MYLVIQLFAPGRTHVVNTLTQIRLPAEQRKVKHGCSMMSRDVSIFFYKFANSPINAHNLKHLLRWRVAFTRRLNNALLTFTISLVR
jgi:hypothetical protein